MTEEGNESANEAAAAEAAAAAATASAAAEAATTDADALTAANAAVTAATGAFRDQIQAANPDLPATAFEGDDVTSIQSNVEGARSILTHAAQYATEHANDKPAAAATPAAAGTTRTLDPIPEGVRGIKRISLGLDRERAARS